MQRDITAAKDQWLSELRQNVDRINYAFEKSFRRIRCVGEVRLHEA